MLPPLRPDLYARLSARFGDVAVAREGEGMIARKCAQQYGDEQGNKILRLEVDQPGEVYRICCPFCNDTRKRLWVNHLWAYREPSEGGKKPVSYMWLVRCFNEDCLSLPGRKSEFYKMVYDDVGYGQHFGEDIVADGKLSPTELKKARPPGLMTPLVQLPLNHPANAYLSSRGYDPRYFATQYRLTFCTKAFDEKYAALLEGRIILPIYMRGELVGWQARYLGEPPDKWCPKYFTMPGFHKTSCLYNFDTAVRYRYAVVTEGATKVWRYGVEGVGLFGNDCSTIQAQLLASSWEVVICLLDGNVPDKNLELYDSIRGGGPQVVLVELPPDREPGDYETSHLRALVAAAAGQRGVLLPDGLKEMSNGS